MTDSSGNVLLLQIGDPCSLMNVGLNALVSTVLNYDVVDDVYGSLGGMHGLLTGDFIDLASQQQKNIHNLLFTPGAALGSCVVTYAETDYLKAVEVLKEKDIRFLFILGDSNSRECCVALESAANKIGYDVKLMLIPFSFENSLPFTDHCLGYGSAAKYMASLFNDVVVSERSKQAAGVVTIVEFSGCDNLWLLNSVAMARKKHDSYYHAPHLILANIFDEQILVKKVHECIHEIGHCVIVVGNKLTNRAGDNIIGTRSAGEYVKYIIQANFDIDVDLVTLYDWMRMSCMTLSVVDSSETVACAHRAVELMIDHKVSGKMVILLRTDGLKYASEISCVDIINTIGKQKEFPEGWYNFEEINVEASFFKYVSPLIIGEIYQIYDLGVQSFAKLR